MLNKIAIVIEVFGDRSVFVQACISQVLLVPDLEFAFYFSYKLFHAFCACKEKYNIFAAQWPQSVL